MAKRLGQIICSKCRHQRKEFIKKNKLQFKTGYEIKNTIALPVSSHVVTIIKKEY